MQIVNPKTGQSLESDFTFDEVVEIHKLIPDYFSQQRVLLFKNMLTPSQIYHAYRIAEEYKTKLPVHCENNIEQFFAKFNRSVYLRYTRITKSTIYNNAQYYGRIREKIFFPTDICPQQIRDDIAYIGRHLFLGVEKICDESGICFLCGRNEGGIGRVCRGILIRR